MSSSRLDAVKRLLSPRSLRYQLLQRSLLILAGLFLLIGVLQYMLMKDFIYQNKAEALSAQMMAMPIDVFKPQPDDRPSRMPRENPILYQPDLSIAFINQNGEMTNLSKSSSDSSIQLSAEEYEEIRSRLGSRKRMDYKLVNDAAGEERLLVFGVAGAPNKTEGLLQVSADTSSLRQLLMTQLAIFSALSLIALAAGLALYSPLLRRTLGPLSVVVQTVHQTDAGSLTQRLPVRQGQEEIDLLSEAFNGMLERLDTSFEAERKTTERMRRFVADASHELRTPLTSIHGFLEVLLRGAAANPEQLSRALNSMQLESRRINKLVEDLLVLAKLNQEPELLLSETSLDELILEMEPQFHVLAGSRKVELHLEENVRGRFHADKLKQVLLNLFLNAVQHTDSEQGTIILSLTKLAQQAEIIISDNGSGISKEHLPHLFERFYRSETSRTRINGGAGLGLSISKAIVDAHHGIIEVQSEPGAGTTFRILLPTVN